MEQLKTLFLFLALSTAMHGYAKTTSGDSLSNKRNILSVVQFQFTENGIGFGSSYERVLDKRGMLAFYIPVMVTFDIANTNRIYDFNTGNYKTGKPDALFYAMPGVKYYPAGNRGKLKYATGASFVIADGQRSDYIPNLGGLNETEQVRSHFLTGLMWQNSLNSNVSEHLYLGLELGIGGTFTNKAGSSTIKNEFLVQGSFKIGFRF